MVSRAKHDERRTNLRRKRAREKLMAHVDHMIKEEVLIAVLQTYLEANFLNDMMNFQHEIINSTVETELRRTIKSLLGEIYFAHISTLFLENYLSKALMGVAKEALIVERQQFGLQIVPKIYMKIEEDAMRDALIDVIAEIVAEIGEKAIIREIIQGNLREIIASEMIAREMIDLALKGRTSEIVIETLMET